MSSTTISSVSPADPGGMSGEWPVREAAAGGPDAAVPASARRVLVPLAVPAPPAVPDGSLTLQALSGATMGTTWSLRCLLPRGQDAGAIAAGVQAVLDEVVAQMSNWRDDTDIGRYNRAPADSWTTLSPACWRVVEAALGVARDTGGAYDPTAGPLVQLWGFGPSGPVSTAPSGAAIDAARQRCGWARVMLDAQGLRAYQPGQLSLDLCAIAKGYGVDAVSAWLRHEGVAHHLIEVGGELRGEGLKPDGLPWWVELETPPSEAALRGQAADAGEGGEIGEAGATGDATPLPIVAAMHGLAIATSGDYRRYFHDRDRRHAHTIDPRTGYPAAHAIASVSVVHPQCMMADALSTALTVLGPEAGMRFATERRIAARMLLRTPGGFVERLSPLFAAMLS